MKDKFIEKLLEDSDRGVFLERITERLPTCRRVIVAFESPHEESDEANFEYFQIGFKHTYEVLGFLEYVKDVVLETDAGVEEGE